MKFHIPRPARSKRRCCANGSRISSCRVLLPRGEASCRSCWRHSSPNPRIVSARSGKLGFPSGLPQESERMTTLDATVSGAQADIACSSGCARPLSRHYVHSEPTSRLAIWARRMAGFAFVASFLAVIIVRSGLLEIRPALATFAGALAIAVIALLLALAAFVVIWMEGLAGMGAALAAMAISLALLAYPAYLGLKAYRLPWIYDITTDPIDPPRFEALARLRVRDANPTTYAGLYAAEQQRAAYPDVGPLGTNATVQAAYDAALAVVNKRRWRIVDARAPQAGRREGRIEAVARTPIMGFRDDVVIRVRAETDGARIDARSTSRYGSFDFGTNAARVRGLMNDIEDAIRAQKPERPPPTQQPAKKSTGKKDQTKR